MRNREFLCGRNLASSARLLQASSIAGLTSLRNRVSIPSEASNWRLAILFYAASAAGNLLVVAPSSLGGVFVDTAGKRWMIPGILWASRLVSIFLMMPLSLIAWVKAATPVAPPRSGFLWVFRASEQAGSYRFVRRISTDKRACVYRRSFTWTKVGFSLKWKYDCNNHPLMQLSGFHMSH